MSRPGWLPAGLGKGFQELVEETKPPLTQGKFEAHFRDFLRSNQLDKLVSKEVSKWLFEQTFSFLRRRAAVRHLRSVVKSPTRKKQIRALAAITKKPPLSAALNRMEEVVKQFEHGRYAFLQPNIKPVRNQIETLRQAITKAEEQFGLVHTLWWNDQQHATDSKPEPESQFIYQIDAQLERTARDLNATTRHLVVGGCLKAAGLLPEVHELKLPEVINSRLERARESNRRLNRANGLSGG